MKVGWNSSYHFFKAMCIKYCLRKMQIIKCSRRSQNNHKITQGRVSNVKVQETLEISNNLCNKGPRSLFFINSPVYSQKIGIKILIFWNCTWGHFFCFAFLFLFFETGSNYVAQAGLEFKFLLPQPPNCWDYRRYTQPLSAFKERYLK
jgi:hypothetical protein